MKRLPLVKTHELRKQFLDYFVEQGHLLVPSASLVPYRDPSVLLTTAGMQPFKPYFLGMADPPARRMTSVQKCFRTTDIDRVGFTGRHCTFFEMLGNFSVGDYFKEGAIRFGYEFSTQHLGLDRDRIWVSVFEGDDQVEPDEEAMGHWEAMGIPRERMVKLPRSENFWGPPGPTGPCGPCSELYFDRGPEFGCDSEDCRPGCDCDRFLEYWNLVFMQYNMDDAKQLTPLPARNIDTGMGLERIAALLQGVPTVFYTDVFYPLIELGQELSGHRFGENEKADVALKVLADHSRAMCFLIADGVLPGQRRSRLCVAADHPPGRAVQPQRRHAAALLGPVCRTRHRDAGGCVPRTARASREHSARCDLGRGAFQPHSRPGVGLA